MAGGGGFSSRRLRQKLVEIATEMLEKHRKAHEYSERKRRDIQRIDKAFAMSERKIFQPIKSVIPRPDDTIIHQLSFPGFLFPSRHLPISPTNYV